MKPKVSFMEDQDNSMMDNTQTRLRKKAFSQLLADALDDLDEAAKSTKKQKRSKTITPAPTDPLAETTPSGRHSI